MRVLFCKISAAFLLIGSLTGAHAKAVKLFEVFNQVDDEKYEMVLEINAEDEATGLRLEDLTNKETTKFDISKINHGMVLKEEGKYKVVVLRSDDFEIDRGGHFVVDTLSSGITGARKEKEFSLDFDGHAWNVFHQGERVKSISLTGRKVLGKIVGIKEVIIN